MGVVERQAADIKQLKIQNGELKSNERKLWERLEKITLSNGETVDTDKGKQSKKASLFRRIISVLVK